MSGDITKCCIINTKFGRNEFATLNKFIFEISAGKNINVGDMDLTISFCEFDNEISISNLYNNFILKKQYGRRVRANNFLKGIDINTRKYIVEIECGNNPNEEYLQYLLCTLQYALYKGIDLYFMFYNKSPAAVKAYEPLDYDNKFRLFLSFYCETNRNLTDYFYYYLKYDKKDSVTKIIDINERSYIKDVGRLLPAISINGATYRNLVGNFSKEESKHSVCEELYYTYVDKIYKYFYFDSTKELIEKSVYEDEHELDSKLMEFNFGSEKCRSEFKTVVSSLKEYVEKYPYRKDYYIIGVVNCLLGLDKRIVKHNLKKKTKDYLKKVNINNSSISNEDKFVEVVNEDIKNFLIDNSDFVKKFKNNIKKDNKIIKMIEKYKNTDNVLDGLIFISTFWYMFFEDKNDKNNPEEKIELLHEICCDYSQGVAQLIENALNHAVEGNQSYDSSNKEHGCANFTIRIRKKDRIKELDYPKEFQDKFSEDINYFMELYITDLQYDNFNSIQKKFIDNSKKRIDVSIKIIQDKDNNKKQKLTTLKNAIGNVKLGDLFTGKDSSEQNALNEYLSLSQNIAFHYGLQILNNTINVANGFLYVKSGDEYSNIEKGTQKTITSKTNELGFDWNNGTAYFIYLPIAMNEPTSNMDTIASTVFNTPNDIQTEEIKISWESVENEVRVALTNGTMCSEVEQKLLRVEKIKKIIQNKTTKTNSSFSNADRIIFYIDCSNCPLITYESLARSVFLCLAEDNIIKNLALVNLSDRHEVIKLFRQFALFYNRSRTNRFMEGKSVYLVDSNAELDFFLQDNLGKMIEDVYNSQINGGFDERAIEIVKHLVR